MAQRRRRPNGHARNPARIAGARHQPRRRPQGRRSVFSRLGHRRAVFVVVASIMVSIAGVAVAGALSSGGNGAGAQSAAAVSSTTPTPTVTPSASHGPLGPTLPVLHSSSPTPRPTPPASTRPHPTATAAPPAPSVSPAAAKAHPCPSVLQRVDAARRRLQHQDALPAVTLQTAGARPGVLATSDPVARTLSLYVRSCGEESTLRLAFVWAYEAGQFIRVEAWDSATRARWQQLRGTTALVSDAQLKQDAASVYAYWQTGATQWWQSPVAPPPAGELSQLTAFLHTS